MSDAARSLRTAERFLLAPPIPAIFGAAAVELTDISSKGVRFRHDTPLENGAKALVKISIDGIGSSHLEAVVVWTHQDGPGKFTSGARTWGREEQIETLLTHLRASRRASRIEELRSTDRFFIDPVLPATFGEADASIADLSARGARIDLLREPQRGLSSILRFRVPDSDLSVAVAGEVVWTSVRAITGATTRSYRAGLSINEKPELLRLAIGCLCEANRASIDTQSLRLKLKIIRARARQMAPAFSAIEESGVPAEQYLLVQNVREELRLNPEEAMHWYRRARLMIGDPATKTIAPLIASHPDALAVWEYLDRSVDPSIVGRAFELPLL